VLRSPTLSLFAFIYLVVECACLVERSDDTCIKTSTRVSAKIKNIFSKFMIQIFKLYAILILILNLGGNMKKKILSFIFAFCLILPFGIMLSGCTNTDNDNCIQIEQVEQGKVLNVNDAYRLYNLALIKYEMGYKDTRSNLKITHTTNRDVDVYKFYTTTDGTQVVMHDNFLHWQEKNQYAAYSYNLTTNVKSSCPYSSFKALHSAYSLGIANRLEENLKSYDIDDNGNYVFVFAEKSENETTISYNIFEYVVSSDLKFISTYCELVGYAKDGSHSPANYVRSRKFEYDTITEDEILSILNTAKQASAQ